MFIRRDSLLCKLCLVPSWVGRVGTHLEAAAPPLQPPVGGCSSLARHPPTCSPQRALGAAEGEHGGPAPPSTGASAAPAAPRDVQGRNETVHARPPGTLRGHLCRNSWKEEKRR